MHYRTKKLVYAKRILCVEAERDIAFQTKLLQSVNKYFGDITTDSNWSFKDASDKDNEELLKARDLSRSWLARRFIEVFFRTCVEDKVRRDFWLQYTYKCNDFRIVCLQSVKNKLRNEPQLDESLVNRYCITLMSPLSVNLNTCALILRMESFDDTQKVFVEFSKTPNALYVYNSNDEHVSSIFTKKYIRDITKLKAGTRMQYLTAYGNKPFGRFIHNASTTENSWVKNLRQWMQQFIGNPKE